MRGRVLIGVAAVFLALPSLTFASGGPGDAAFGNGKYPRESRTFSSCKRFAATIPFYRSCLEDAATALVIKTNDPADELPRIDEYVHTQAGWLQANCHVMMHRSEERRVGK